MISESRKPRVIAHRGASGHAPETTLAAYRLALQIGVDGIEADVHRLRDGTIVAMHDPDVKRTTNSKGKISKLTLAEIKALDAGAWFNNAYPEKARPEYAGLKVPTLQEIIDLIRESSVELYMEIKDPELYPEDLEYSLLSILHANQMAQRTHCISFSAKSIRKIKALNPSMHTGLLISRFSRNPIQAALEASADELAIRYNLATPAVADAAHAKGLLFSVWTVDAPADLQRMIQLGADRIITNYPDRLNRLLGKDKLPV
jgi:glycerophosphoryl diester phosphodiesterase